MKICIISMTNIFLCPYIKKYLNEISVTTNIDLIYWDRHTINESVSFVFDHIYCYRLSMDEHHNKFLKFINFIRFKHYCEKILTKNNYDKIIFLHNYLAILMYRYLSSYYNGRYLVDVRDYSYEHNRLFYNIEKLVIKNSGLAVISSLGYKTFLPEHNYVLCHNDPIVDDEIVKHIQDYKWTSDKPIKLSFIGLVRFYEQNIKLLEFFKNDERFLLAFYGQNSDFLKEYANRNNIKNVFFKGRFEPSETMKFFKQTDIVNNYYGNNTPSLDYALSNKLYYAATFFRPILVCKNTYMEKIAKKYSFAITMDEKQNANDFYKEFLSIDRSKLRNGCMSFINKVKNDNDIFKYNLNKFLIK